MIKGAVPNEFELSYLVFISIRKLSCPTVGYNSLTLGNIQTKGGEKMEMENLVVLEEGNELTMDGPLSCCSLSVTFEF